MNKSESKYFNTATKMDIALISLMKKKPFAYITVSEICKAAGVNRSTFYLHYETISDLLSETSRYLLDEFLGYFTADAKTAVENLNKRNLADLVFTDEKYITPYLTYIQDHKEVFCTALLHMGTLGLEDVYRRMFENIFKPILGRFEFPADTHQYVIMYYLNGIHAIILEWLRNGCDKSIREITEIISICIYGKGHTDR